MFLFTILLSVFAVGFNTPIVVGDSSDESSVQKCIKVSYLPCYSRFNERITEENLRSQRWLKDTVLFESELLDIAYQYLDDLSNKEYSEYHKDTNWVDGKVLIEVFGYKKTLAIQLLVSITGDVKIDNSIYDDPHGSGALIRKLIPEWDCEIYKVE